MEHRGLGSLLNERFNFPKCSTISPIYLHLGSFWGVNVGTGKGLTLSGLHVSLAGAVLPWQKFLLRSFMSQDCHG